jgi:type IV pilus assembly protein PilB
LVVAVCDPTNLLELEDLRVKVKMNVEAVLTTYSAFDAAMGKYYSGVAFVSSAIETYKKEGNKNDDSPGFELVEVHNIDSGSNADDAPVISVVNGILSEAVSRNASDVHVEPYERKFRIRMRIDGVLHEMATIPGEMKRAVITRFKIMSRMDISESRIPQDGRIKLRHMGREIDFRVSSLPTLFGEKMVLRMLSAKNLQLDFKKLGFEQEQLEIFKKGIYAPNGMVLVTGPTGSGKTTTLYSAISELNKVADNISTVEDPVEYNLEGVNQVQIHKEIGLTFAGVLRALLRQDPDIILVGEIRDYETAEVGVQAALTGHLVLSTLHTNDAPSTIIRLINMGLEPFLVVASLNTIVAQRLIRTICDKCKAEKPISPKRLIEMGVPEAQAATAKVWAGKGCAICANTGYKGRLAIYEVMDFNNSLKEMVLSGSTALDLRKEAIKQGMKTLRMAALHKAMEGVTTLEEAYGLTTEN